MSKPHAAPFRPGTVVSYLPDQSRHDPRWCREGIAIADNRGKLVDTFWQGTTDSHIVTDVEAPSVQILFDLADYDELDRYAASSRATWETYAPADRATITSQHGLQRRWFIRKGATPDHATQVQNARDALERAESALRSAERDVEWLRHKLEETINQEAATT